MQGQEEALKDIIPHNLFMLFCFLSLMIYSFSQCNLKIIYLGALIKWQMSQEQLRTHLFHVIMRSSTIFFISNKIDEN